MVVVDGEAKFGGSGCHTMAGRRGRGVWSWPPQLGLLLLLLLLLRLGHWWRVDSFPPPPQN